MTRVRDSMRGVARTRASVAEFGHAFFQVGFEGTPEAPGCFQHSRGFAFSVATTRDAGLIPMDHWESRWGPFSRQKCKARPNLTVEPIAVGSVPWINLAGCRPLLLRRLHTHPTPQGGWPRRIPVYQGAGTALSGQEPLPHSHTDAMRAQLSPSGSTTPTPRYRVC